MYSIAQGLVALGKLQKEKPASVKLAEALKLKQERPSLLASLTLPATDVIDTRLRIPFDFLDNLSSPPFPLQQHLNHDFLWPKKRRKAAL
jgi:hypothetical protein